MRKSLVIAITIVALAVGIAIRRFALHSPTSSASIAAVTKQNQDDAAEAASRAMTFTQPKAPSR